MITLNIKSDQGKVIDIKLWRLKYHFFESFNNTNFY